MSKCKECGEDTAAIAGLCDWCCDHRAAEPGDRRNDAWYCPGCARFVIPENGEDGGIEFEVLYDI